ncbi:ras-related protein Rab-31 isoform X8 [Cricetulus griseus]|uniref:Ras-related protein Rab-31 isoform X8 n=1 Tax=Cricetulus griseus TaxID=10029 RepID=A0A9J7FAG7_CRIGR|nr:ras-related protein Rab-31 isoform X8 [Cricetulus griseus]
MMAIRELKVCLLGDTGVGKSSIVCRFVQDHFDHNISPTIGASFMTKTVPCGNELHKFLIWDTAGQERFHSLAPMYYRGSAAAVIVYDITKQDSFHTLKKWVKELKEHGPENIVMAIAGNKCDLSDIRSIPRLQWTSETIDYTTPHLCYGFSIYKSVMKFILYIRHSSNDLEQQLIKQNSL